MNSFSFYLYLACEIEEYFAIVV